jgi:NAD(P)-dependent dehydrogenase (short-subunit alcohol dehydrogenase family)
MGIENESVVIIGGSSGMGLAIAKEAADAGAAVTIAGRSQSKLDEASRAIAGDVTTYIVDLSDEGSVMKLFQSIGSFDHLVIRWQLR